MMFREHQRRLRHNDQNRPSGLNKERPPGHQDRPSGHNQERPSGHQDRPSGHQDRPSGLKPSGNQNRPSGHQDRPSGHNQERPSGRMCNLNENPSEFITSLFNTAPKPEMVTLITAHDSMIADLF